MDGTDHAQKAISAALNGNWEEAKKYNKLVLETDPDNIDALNRYARACVETGKVAKARKTSKKVLAIDPYNQIAIKSLERWKFLKNSKTPSPSKTSTQTFLEEPGKTKIVHLINLGAENILAGVDAGDNVQLHTHGHRVSVCTLDGKYIGRLADDLSRNLKRFMEYGNEYEAYIKSTNPTEVMVFLRETKRVRELIDIPSFTTEKVEYVSFTPPELVRKKEHISKLEDEDEKD